MIISDHAFLVLVTFKIILTIDCTHMHFCFDFFLFILSFLICRQKEMAGEPVNSRRALSGACSSRDNEAVELSNLDSTSETSMMDLWA